MSIDMATPHVASSLPFFFYVTCLFDTSSVLPSLSVSSSPVFLLPPWRVRRPLNFPSCLPARPPARPPARQFLVSCFQVVSLLCNLSTTDQVDDRLIPPPAACLLFSQLSMDWTVISLSLPLPLPSPSPSPSLSPAPVVRLPPFPQSHNLAEQHENWTQLFRRHPDIGTRYLLPELIPVLIQYLLADDHISTSLFGGPKPAYDLVDWSRPLLSGVLQLKSVVSKLMAWPARQFIVYDRCLEWHRVRPVHEPAMDVSLSLPPPPVGRIRREHVISIRHSSPNRLDILYRLPSSTRQQTLEVMAANSAAANAWIDTLQHWITASRPLQSFGNSHKTNK